MELTLLEEKQQKKIRGTVSVLALIIGVIFSFTIFNHLKPEPLDITRLQAEGTYIYQKPRPLPEFTLIDENGVLFSKINLSQDWNLFFFGFTHCPHICPTTLADLRQVKQQLKAKVDITMVTIDPVRDDSKQLKAYLNGFDPSFRGLTGDQSVIFNLAKSMNVVYEKVEDSNALYNMDHSGHIAIVNPKGEFIGLRKAIDDPEVFSRHLKQLIASY